MLVEGIDYSSVINVTDVENLHIITSGPKPPNPAELLGSRKMEEFLRAVREDYDIIIADTTGTAGNRCSRAVSVCRRCGIGRGTRYGNL